jgi:hypothetical protein
MSVTSSATAAVAAQQALTQTSLQNAALKNAFKAEQAVVSVIQEAVKSAPPAGAGKAIDITA